MINEDFCSFEVSKLLREKGFNEPVTELNKLLFREGEEPVLKITHQKAMRWLREVHNLFIEPRAGETNGKTWYDFDIIPINGKEIVWNHYNNLPFVECNSYEEAVEAALKYCLENLI